MDDAMYVFEQTSKERKRTGRGAGSKRNGSKTKKCGLPSDHLSAAEMKKLNGEVKTYDLSKPMTWDEFRGMSPDLQSEYIRKLAAMGAGRNDISDMFRVKPFTYSNYMCEHHRGEKFMSTSKKKDNDEFIAWFLGEEYVPKKEETTAAPEPEKLKDKKKTEEPKKEEMKRTALPEEDEAAEEPKHPILVSLQGGTISYVGNAREIFERILILMDEDADYEIAVSFNKAAIGYCSPN